MKSLILLTCFLLAALIAYGSTGLMQANAVSQAIACAGGTCDIVTCEEGSCTAASGISTFTEDSDFTPSNMTESDSGISEFDTDDSDLSESLEID